MENRIILKIRAGSFLYGLNTPDSDEDYLGIYLSTPEELLGLQKSEIIEDNVVSKQENGKNDKDAVDCKYYELRKFCNLALNANPSILEMLFANNENILIMDKYGKKLIENRDKFLSLKVKHSYIGYAFSQKQKSYVKTKNLRILIEARKLLLIENHSDMLYKTVLCKKSNEVEQETEIRLKYGEVVKLDNNFPDYIGIADVKFNNQKVKDVIKKLDDRINKATNRASEMLDKGYDPKFISHTVRLLKEGEELLKEGKITFPLKDRDELLDIKLGKRSPEEVMEYIENLEALFDKYYDESPLPHAPDFQSANNLIIGIYKEYLSSVL